MKVSVSLCALLCATLQLHAQKKIEGHWGKAYLDVAYATAATDDGGYIITGLTKCGINDPYGDIFVVKLDAQADTMWTFTYGGPFLEGGNSVIQTADGGYLVAGHTQDFGAVDCDAFFMKLDKAGHHQWFRVYGGDADDISEQVIQLADGGYVFAGITASYGNPPNDSTSRHVYFIRTNSVGDTTWTRYYAGGAQEEAFSIVAMPLGGFLAAGWSTSYGKGEYDGYLFRLKDNGDTLWTRLYQQNGNSRYYKIIPTTDNGYILAGLTTADNASKSKGLIIKLDANGNQLWERKYGDGVHAVLFRDVAQLPDGDLMFTGQSFSVDTTGNVYVLTTDANGVMITDELCGGIYSYATGIALQGNNSYLVAGTTAQYGDPYGDMYYMEEDNTISGVPGVSLAFPNLFPNPVTGISSVILPEAEAYQTVSVDITDIDGRRVSAQEHVNAKDLTISRNELLPGVYLLQVSCSDGKVFKRRFTVK